MVLGMRMMRTSGRMYAEGLTGNKGGGARSRAGEGRFGGIVGGLRRFAADERGATAIEYGLIVAGLAALLVGGTGGPPLHHPFFCKRIQRTLSRPYIDSDA